MTKLLTLTSDTVPVLPRHAKLRYDEARKKFIINAPERVFELDEIASEIMQLVDGLLSLKGIVKELLKKYKEASEEEITTDVLSMLQSLADKGFIIK